MASADLSPSFPNSPASDASSAGAPLHSRLQLLARRRNALKMRSALVRSAIPGVLVASLGVLAYKLHLIADGPLWVPPVIIGATLLWGARNGWMERRGNFAAARDADATLDLDDRLSSALAFVAPAEVKRQQRVQGGATRVERLRNALVPRFAISTSPTALSTNLVPALVSDASSRAVALNPKQVYPAKFDRPMQILTLLAVVFVGVCLMPDIPLFLSQQEKQDRIAIMKEGEKLLTVSKQIRKQESPKADDVQRLNQKLQKLGQKMAKGRMTKRAALTEIGALKKELQKAKQQKPNDQKQESAGMPQIPEALRQAPLQSKVGKEVQQKVLDNKWDEAAKKLEEAADRLEKGQMSEQEKKQTADDLDKVAEQLKQRGGQANQEAAKQLQEAAKQLRQAQNPQQNQQNPAQQGQQDPQQQGQQSQNGQNQQQKQPQGQQGQQQGKEGQQQQKDGKGQQQQGSQGQQQPKDGQSQQQQAGQGQQQQGGKQGQSQQSQGGQGQMNQQQQGQQGQQGADGQQQGQGQQGQSNSGASNALRGLANGLRQGGGGQSGSLDQMMQKLREAENGSSGSQAGQGPINGMGPGTQGGGGNEANIRNLKPGQLRPTSGQGNNMGGPGLGPRDKSTGNKGSQGVSKFRKPNTGDKRRYGDVWSDRLPRTHAKLDRVTGKWGSEGDVDQLPTKGEAKGGSAKTPFYEVYESYKKDAEDAVSRDTVPPAYKNSVKDYFESLKP